MAHRFAQPALETDWKSYHDIRRTVLFEARGRFGVYQDGHPDEYAEGNHPFLLFQNDQPIGAIRIDLPAKSNEAIFRRLAIVIGYQRQGHGTTLMREAETFAIANNRFTFVANVALDAVPFYEKLGYELTPDSPENDPANPRMVKIHSPSTPAPIADAAVYQQTLAGAAEVAKMKRPLLATLLLLCLAFPAAASSFLDGSLSEVVKVSEYIFAGKIVGVRMTDGKGEPITDPEAATGPGLDNTIWLDVAVDRHLVQKAPDSKVPGKVSVRLWTTRHCTLGQIKEADHSKSFFLLDKEFKSTYPGDFPISIKVETRLKSIVHKEPAN